MNYKRIFAFFCIFFLLFFGLSLIEAGQVKLSRKSITPLKIGAKLKALPPSYSGRCPTTIRFTGTIAVSRAASVSYQFIRSNGGKSPVLRLKFTRKGSKKVQTSWRVKKTTRGFMQIRIIKPLKTASARAMFSVQCKIQAKNMPKNSMVSKNPFAIKIDPGQGAGYRHRIHINAKIQPKIAVNKVREIIKNKTFYLYIDNKKAAQTRANFPHIIFRLSDAQTTKLNIKPGKHKIVVQTFHNGKPFVGQGIYKVNKVHIKITELTHPYLYWEVGGKKKYYTCHNIGDKLMVAAKFTHSTRKDIPIKNRIVYYRVFNRKLASAKTDHQGIVKFTFVLKPRETFFAESIPPPGNRPYVKFKYHFYVPESDCYYEASDWGRPERIIYACPAGMVYDKANHKCVRQ